MKSTKVISSKNLPVRLPVFPTITMWLLLDRLHASGWIWGAVGALFVVIWIGTIAGVMKQDSVDIFKDQ